MRALRVLGLADGDDRGVKNLVCEDPTTGEQFSLPCDDRLRAGARGDLSRFGQLEIELESQLRPREIQTRIRAGATVEQVASMAGTTIARVERFAYPVLLERVSVAEKARKARPAIDGITATISVEETVTATLAARGHEGDIAWDAFKDDDGWVLALTWTAGRSENRAHWLFHPGPDGGTLSARDEAAAEIVDPALRILRPLRPVRQDSVSAVLLDPTTPTEDAAAEPHARTASPAARAGALPLKSEPASRAVHPAGSKLPAPGPRLTSTPAPSSPRFGLPAPRPSRPTAPVGRQSPSQQVDSVRTERIVEDTITDDRAGVIPVSTRTVSAQTEVARTGTEPAARPAAKPADSPDAAAGQAKAAPRRSHRPAMPSWEDVLLGTRSTGR